MIDAVTIYDPILSQSEDPARIQREVLQTAEKLICGDRADTYGDAYTDFSKTAKMLSATFGADVTPAQVAISMIQVKLSRLLETPDHRDSWVDICGYAALGAYVADRQTESAEGGE